MKATHSSLRRVGVIGVVSLAAVLAILAGAGSARAQVTIAPGEALAFSAADGCVADTVVPAPVTGLAGAASDCDPVTRRARAQVRPIAGAGWAAPQQTVKAFATLRNDFTVEATPGTAGRRVGAWVSYEASFKGLVALFGFVSRPTVEIAVTLVDLTDGKAVKGELVWARDGSGFGVGIPYVPIDFNFGGGRDSHAVSSSLAAVLTRGHAYRVEFTLVCSVFGDGGLDPGTECDYFDDFAGGDGGGVGWTRLEVKVGLDEAEVQTRLAQLDDLRRQLEGHTHVYLTGRGQGHNNTEAQTSSAILPVTSALSLAISPPSGVYATTQAFDLQLIVGAPGRAVAGGSAVLDGRDVTPALAPCLIRGRLLPAGQTLRCPGLTGGLLGAGTHRLAVTLEFDDQTSVGRTVIWDVVPNAEP